MKILSFTFELRSEEGKEEVLAIAEKLLKQRALSCRRAGNNIVATFRHEDWEKPAKETGASSFPENSFWDIEVPGVKFTNITALYGEAIVPDRENPGRDLDGKSCWGEAFHVVAECEPKRKMITLSMNVPEFDCSAKSRQYRLEFIGVQRKFEKMIKLSRALSALVAAYKKEYDADLDDSIGLAHNELLALIGGI